MGDLLSSFKVVKLNDDNFHIWKQRIKLVLAYCNLDNQITNDPPSASRKNYKVWKKSDARARAIIGLSLSDEYVEHVRDFTTAKNMWKAILNVFERHSILNRLSARRDFYTVTMNENEKMLTYVNRVRQLASTLKSMNAAVDDAEVAMATLNGLPEQYNELIVALDALGNGSSLTTEFVMSKLLQQEKRIKLRLQAKSVSSVVKPESVARVNNAKINKRRFNNSQSSIPFCDYCHKTGHSTKICWSLLGHIRSRGSMLTKNISIADQPAETKLKNEQGAVCLTAKASLAPTTSDEKSNWIIDSVASAHMANNRASFIEYTQIEPFDVELGHKYKASAVGKGTVSMKIILKGKAVTCLLTDALHIPELGHNLISVSTMDAKGMETNFFNGQCRVTKNGRLLAEGFRNKGLYFLRLAHVSTKGIESMVKNDVAKVVQIDSDKKTDMYPIQDTSVASKVPRFLARPNISLSSALRKINKERVEAVSDGELVLRRSKVRGDGRCLFRSVVRARAAQRGGPLPLEQTEREEADKLRARTVKELRGHKKLLQRLHVIEGKFGRYLKRMSQPRAHGGEPELLMLAKILHTPIAVYIMAGRLLRRIQLYGKQYTGVPIRVLYSDCIHYDALLNHNSTDSK